MECGNCWTSRSSGRRGYMTSKPQEKYPLYFIMYTAGIDSLLLFLRHWSNSVLASELRTRGCWEVVQKIGWKALSQRSGRKWNRQTSQVEAIPGVGFVVPSFFHTSKQHFSVLFLKSKALSLLCPCSKLSHPFLRLTSKQLVPPGSFSANMWETQHLHPFIHRFAIRPLIQPSQKLMSSSLEESPIRNV